ncbi:MAG: response regulator transcription factor [Nitrososphaerota archaeon]|nr:response regulator transcription factor [Nitrososphaerota archaeon]MDG6921716.1 response regulator transcription factor [Nitrososphaerota archaeon]
MTRILIVGDRADLRTTISISLQRHGFQISTASDARKAITAFTKEVPEITILDLESLGNKCIETASRMLTMRSSTKLIVLASRSADLDDMEQIGVDVLLTKPFPLETLVESVIALSKMKPPLNIIAK